MLDHHHRIRSRRQRSSGHDLNRLTLGKRSAKPALARPHRTHNPQRPRQIPSTHRIPIARGPIDSLAHLLIGALTEAAIFIAHADDKPADSSGDMKKTKKKSKKKDSGDMGDMKKGDMDKK